MKKKILIASSLAITTLLLASALCIFNDNNNVYGTKSKDKYELRLDGSNGAVFTTAYSEPKTTNAQTTSKMPVTFGYTGAYSYNPSYDTGAPETKTGVGSFTVHDGSYYNTTPITNISAVTVDFKGELGIKTYSTPKEDYKVDYIQRDPTNNKNYKLGVEYSSSKNPKISNGLYFLNGSTLDDKYFDISYEMTCKHPNNIKVAYNEFYDAWTLYWLDRGTYLGVYLQNQDDMSNVNIEAFAEYTSEPCYWNYDSLYHTFTKTIAYQGTNYLVALASDTESRYPTIDLPIINNRADLGSDRYCLAHLYEIDKSTYTPLAPNEPFNVPVDLINETYFFDLIVKGGSKNTMIYSINVEYKCDTYFKTQKDTNEITIFSLNDTHGDLLRDASVGSCGMDGAAYLMKQEAFNNGYEDPLFFTLGDMFQGQYVSNMTHGRAIVDAINYLGVDVFVLGNHEFDWGLEYIHQYKDGNEENGEIHCDILGANLYQKSINKRPDWVKPYTIIEHRGHKIGVIGFIGENIEGSIAADMVKDYEFTPVIPLANKYAEELNNKGCDTILLAIHDYQRDFDRNENVNPNSFRNMASQIKYIDGIFGGHTHMYDLDQFTNADGEEIFSMQAKANNEAFGVMNFKYDKSNKIIERNAHIAFNNSYEPFIDNELHDYIYNKYKAEFDSANEVLSDNFPGKTRQQWGAYITERMANSQTLSADFGIMNTGGVRDDTLFDIDPNVLYMKRLFKVLPFDNKIVTVSLPIRFYQNLLDTNFTNFNYVSVNPNFNPENHSEIIVNVLDFVFYGKYNRNIWNNATVLSASDILLRDFVAQETRLLKA